MANDSSFHVVAAGMFIIFGFTKIIFSFLIITIIVFNWNTKFRSIINLHACNSCITTLFYVFAVVLEVPILIEATYIENFHVSSVFCEICGFIFCSACAIKSYSYLAQAVSRYLITIHYKKRILLTYRANLIMIFMSWLAGLLVSSLLFLTPNAYEYVPESHFCLISSKKFLISFYPIVFIFVIPAILIIFLYGLVLWDTTRFNRIHPNSISKNRNKRNIKVFRNIFIILTLFIVGGTPYFICIIIGKITQVPHIDYLISIVFISLANTLEMLTIFFSNDNLKKILRAKIGLYNTEAVNTIRARM